MLTEDWVLDAVAGSELDEAVGALMGYTFQDEEHQGKPFRLWHDAQGVPRREKRYSTNMEHAFEVAKKYGIALIPQSDGEGFRWYACDVELVSYRGEEIAVVPLRDSGISAETPEEAICKAALLSQLRKQPPTKEEKVEAFLSELTALSAKHGLRFGARHDDGWYGPLLMDSEKPDLMNPVAESVRWNDSEARYVFERVHEESDELEPSVPAPPVVKVGILDFKHDLEFTRGRAIKEIRMSKAFLESGLPEDVPHNEEARYFLVDWPVSYPVSLQDSTETYEVVYRVYGE